MSFALRQVWSNMMSLILVPLYAAISIINWPLLWLLPQLDVFNFWTTALYVSVALCVVTFFGMVSAGRAKFSDLWTSKQELEIREWQNRHKGD
jgi:hypothetical protein